MKQIVIIAAVLALVLAGAYAEGAACDIVLSGTSAIASGDGVTIAEGIVTITAAGEYIVSGEYDGQIIVDADKDAEVTLTLNGVDIYCATGPALYVKKAEKLAIKLPKGYINTFADGSDYAIDDEGADAAIYSKDDIEISGAGDLIVAGNTKHGIVSKDDLVIKSGNVDVSAIADALRGRDSVVIEGGDVEINAGSDGIKTTNDEDKDKGYIEISGGNIAITAVDDGIQAETGITIEGGTFTLNTEDDGMHAAGDILVKGGMFTIASGDDGMHSDAQIVIDGGVIKITKCYEGIEGSGITINAGDISIISDDDGLNAAGGADGSAKDTGRGMRDMFMSDGVSFITINGGKLYVYAIGDAIDSNGDLTINGGVLDLTCAGRGNTAIDAAGTYSNNGGSVTTNDGSEEGGGMRGFGGGRQGGKQRPEWR